MNDSTTAQADSPPYLKAWDEYAIACQTLFERLSNPSAADAGSAIPLAFLGSWRDFAASLGMRPDGTAADFKPEDKLAGMFPALGYSREYQEIGRRMLELTGQFQRRYADFIRQSADIGQSALQATQRRASNDEAMLASPSAIYDAWIDCAEAAYAQAAHGEPFARLLADLCNILSGFKIERGKLMEAFARQLDLPGRTEVDSLHHQVRKLKTAAGRGAAAGARGAVKSTAAKEKAKEKTKPKAKAKPAFRPAAAARPATGGKRRDRRKKRQAPRRHDS
jgi:hypothetical protein